MSTPPSRPLSELDRRAAVAHPSLQRTLRSALELTARELPEFDAGTRRMLVARYRGDEGPAAATPASRAKARVIANEAAFRSMLPRIVAIGLNAEFQRLDGHPTVATRPEDGPTPRAAAIAAFAGSFAADDADVLAELSRRIAHQLGRATLSPRENPLRPAVFLNAVGTCWRAVAGSDRDELDVMTAYGILWVPVLRRTIAALVAGLPPAPGSAPAPTPASTAPGAASATRGESLVERWAASMAGPDDATRPVVPPAPRTPAPPRLPADVVERLRAGFGAPPRDPSAAPA